jgi:hypothetical protein
MWSRGSILVLISHSRFAATGSGRCGTTVHMHGIEEELCDYGTILWNWKMGGGKMGS